MVSSLQHNRETSSVNKGDFAVGDAMIHHQTHKNKIWAPGSRVSVPKRYSGAALRFCGNSLISLLFESWLCWLCWQSQANQSGLFRDFPAIRENSREIVDFGQLRALLSGLTLRKINRLPHEFPGIRDREKNLASREKDRQIWWPSEFLSIVSSSNRNGSNGRTKPRNCGS